MTHINYPNLITGAAGSTLGVELGAAEAKPANCPNCGADQAVIVPCGSSDASWHCNNCATNF
jgi:hypothetical protein